MSCEGCLDKVVVRVQVWYPTEMYDNVPWEQLPDDGVQAVLLHYADGNRRVMMGTDYYFRALGVSDNIYGQGDGLEDIVKRYESPVVLRGSWTDDANLERIIGEIHADA